jgi:hypothetical protein
MGQLVFAVAGAAVGSLVGAPQLGFAIGSTIGAAVFAPKTPGPKLQDLKVTGLEYGTPIPVVFGNPRVPGVVVWSSDKIPVKSGGGGGKGGPEAPESITYKQNILYKLTANEGAGVRRIWDGGKLIWTLADTSTAESRINSAETDEWESIEVFTGGSTQSPWSVYEAVIGVGLTPAHRGCVTVGITGLNLGAGGYPRQLTFEVVREGADVLPNDGTLLDLPFTTNGADLGPAPTATKTDTVTTGLISYSGGRATFARADASNTSSAYGGNKLDNEFALNYSLVTVEAKGVTVNTYASVVGSTVTTRFLIVQSPNTSGDEYNFGFDFGNGGPPNLRANVFPSTGGSFPTVVGLAPIQADYKIVRDQTTGTVKWLVNDVVVKTYSRAGPYRAGTISFGLYNAATDRTVTSLSFDSVSVKVDIASLPLRPDTLQFVLEELSRECGLEDAYTDATACSAINVDALAVSQVTSARQVIEGTLAPAYSFTSFEDDKLTYVLRGGSSVASIPYLDLGAKEGEAESEPLPIVNRTTIELPAQIAVSSANTLDDYQKQTSYSDTLVGATSSVSQVDLALALRPQTNKRVADIRIRQASLSRRQIGPIGVMKNWSALRPTDLITLTDKTGSTFLAFITCITDTGPVRSIEFELDDASVWTSTALTDNTNNSSTIVKAVEFTNAFYLDIPILRDSENEAGAYVAVAPKTSVGVWPGAAIYRGIDDTSYLKQVEVLDRTLLGVAITSLGAWDGIYASDEKNTVTVTLSGAASSYTDDAIINGLAPLWLIGNELIYARTASLVSDTTYILSGLYRARRGTSYATSTHAIGDRVVLIQTNGLRRLPYENGQLGVEYSMKAVTFGKPIATADKDLFTNTGNGLKPFPPVHLKAVDNGAGTYSVSWTRRTRLSCRFTGSAGINTPLGEASESYAVDVWNGSTVTSTQTVSTQSATVTASATNTVRVYQLSATVGRGFVAEIVL